MLNTILVALDDSELSERVLQMLEQLPIRPETKVILSHVVPATGTSLDQAADQPQTRGGDSPYQYIEKKLQACQANLSCQSDLEIISGDPAEEIIRLANIHQSDLILMGNRGLTGMNRIIQGSVSSQVVTEAPCSVLVVKM